MSKNKDPNLEERYEKLIPPCEEEIRYILLKVVEQAIRDYINFGNAHTPSEKWAFETARAFLFDNDYLIDWGGKDLSLIQILAILDIDIEWLREKVEIQKIKRLKKRASMKRIVNKDYQFLKTLISNKD